MPQIVIQEIVTEWSKASRGGAEAGLRNAVPTSMKLPAIPAGVDVAVHALRYVEADRFRTPKSTLSTDRLLPLRLGCVTMKAAGDCVLASFRYTFSCGGAPERGWMRKDIRLSPGQWAQVEYNGRFSVEAYWFYRHTILNIAVVDTVDPRLFTHSKPNVRFSAMALLR